MKEETYNCRVEWQFTGEIPLRELLIQMLTDTAYAPAQEQLQPDPMIQQETEP